MTRRWPTSARARSSTRWCSRRAGRARSGCRRSVAGCSRLAPSGCLPATRRQAADRLERADDRRAGSGRSRPRTSRATARLRALQASSCSASYVTSTAGCCAPGRTAGPRCSRSSTTTRSCWRPCSTSTRRRFEPRWYHEAVTIADQLIERFADPEQRRLLHHFARARASSPARRKDLEDSPVPSGNSAAALALAAPCPALSGEAALQARTPTGVLALLFPLARRHPHSFGHLLRAADFASRRCARSRSSDRDPEPLLAVVRRAPARISCSPAARPTACPLLADRPPVDGRATAYVCEHFSCRAPVTRAGRAGRAARAPVGSARAPRA